MNIKKYLYEIIIGCLFLLFTFIGLCYGQMQNVNKSSATTQIRTNVSSNDTWLPVGETTLGTPFDASKFEKVRIYVKIKDSTGTTADNSTSFTIRPLIWNRVCEGIFSGTDTPDGWSVDSPEVITGVTNNYTFLWETRHANSVQMLVDTISGTGLINVYMQGSNSLNLER